MKRPFFLLWLFIILTFNNCRNQVSLDKKFALTCKIDLDEFYEKGIAKQFLTLSSNELGLYCPISFEVGENHLYIPSRVKNEIKRFEYNNGKYKYKGTITTNYIPSFIEKMLDKTWYYSVFNKHTIFQLNSKEAIINKPIDVYFKNCGENIIYSSEFYFYNTNKPNDSIFYENIHSDWDYFMTSDNELLVLNYGHQNKNGVFLERLNSSHKEKPITIDSATHYNTFKILGFCNSKIVLLLGNESKIELIFCDKNSLKILQRLPTENPFKDELMMGDYSDFWPNQFVCKMKHGTIYLLGTSRKSILIYSLKIQTPC